MKKKTLFVLLLTAIVFCTSCIFNLELFIALAKTALYLGGTTLFVLLPFLVFKGEKKEKEAPKEIKQNTVPHPIMHRKVKSVKTTLLEKGEKETTYMSIYSVNNSP